MLETIKKGSKCNAVKIAKYLIGYSKAGKASSTFDSKFHNHVVAWQKTHGLNADGVINSDDWTLIALNAPTVSKANKAAVYAFQLATGLTANGSYNSAVKKVINDYQRASGLIVDGVCGAKTWCEVIALKPVAHTHTRNYKQNDVKWSNVIYSKNRANTKQTIGNSGCAPTSAASIVGLVDRAVTPVAMANYAIAKGDRRSTGGTDGTFFTHVGEKFGYRVVETTNKSLFKHCLDSGGYVVCAFKAGSWWTSCGHYSPCWHYDSKYYYVDNTISKIKIKREISKLSKDCRAFYLMYPIKK